VLQRHLVAGPVPHFRELLRAGAVGHEGKRTGWGTAGVQQTVPRPAVYRGAGWGRRARRGAARRWAAARRIVARRRRPAIFDRQGVPFATAGLYVQRVGSGARENVVVKQRREQDSTFPESVARPNTNGAPHLRARARRGWCDHLTNFLPQKCQHRYRHPQQSRAGSANLARGWREPRREANSDQTAIPMRNSLLVSMFAPCVGRPPHRWLQCLQPAEEGPTDSAANATEWVPHATACGSAGRSAPPAPSRVRYATASMGRPSPV
jgi:hypothetical protein